MLIFNCLMLFESTLLDSFSFSSRISFLNMNSWNYLSENSCFLLFFSSLLHLAPTNHFLPFISSDQNCNRL